MRGWQRELWRARAGSRDASGSLTLALLVVVAVLVISVGIVSVVAFQVANDRREEAQRRAQWGVDTAMNLAAEQLGNAGRNVSGLLGTEPASSTPLPGGAAAKWWFTSNDIPAPATITLPAVAAAVGSDGGSWLMVSTSNDFYRSTDGRTWSPAGTVPGAAVGEIASFNNVLIAVPASANTGAVQNPLRRSTDGGKTWSSMTLPGTWSGTETTFDMACSAASCVLVAAGGRAYRTTDGTAWSAVGTSPTALTAIAFGNGRYVTVGTNTASTSVDEGSTWTNAAGMTNGAWALIGFGNNTFYTAVKNSNTQTVLSSSNGTTWSSQTLANAGSYTAFGSSSPATILLPTTGSTYGLSSDGLAWITRPAPTTANWLGAAYLNRSWLFAQTGSLQAYLVGMNAVTVPLPTNVSVNVKVQVANLASPLLAQTTYTWGKNRWTPSAYSAAQTNLSVPSAPTSLAATSGTLQQVGLTWGAPTSDGGAPVTSYTVYLGNSITGPWTQIAAGLTATSYTTTGLLPGSTYWFQVTASNWVGEGAPSTTTNGIAIDLPSAPVITGSSSAVVGQLNVSFTPPTATSTRPVASQTARACTNAAMTTDCLTPVALAANATAAIFTGGTPGTLYHLRVDATNNAGTTVSTTSTRNVAYNATASCPSGGATLSGTTCGYAATSAPTYSSCPTSWGSPTCTYASGNNTATCTGTQSCSQANAQTCTWNTCPASWGSPTCNYSSGNGTGTCNGTQSCSFANPNGQTCSAGSCPSSWQMTVGGPVCSYSAANTSTCFGSTTCAYANTNATCPSSFGNIDGATCTANSFNSNTGVCTGTGTIYQSRSVTQGCPLNWTASGWVNGQTLCMRSAALAPTCSNYAQCQTHGCTLTGSTCNLAAGCTSSATASTCTTNYGAATCTGGTLSGTCPNRTCTVSSSTAVTCTVSYGAATCTGGTLSGSCPTRTCTKTTSTSGNLGTTLCSTAKPTYCPTGTWTCSNTSPRPYTCTTTSATSVSCPVSYTESACSGTRSGTCPSTRTCTTSSATTATCPLANPAYTDGTCTNGSLSGTCPSKTCTKFTCPTNWSGGGSSCSCTQASSANSWSCASFSQCGLYACTVDTLSGTCSLTTNDFNTYGTCPSTTGATPSRATYSNVAGLNTTGQFPQCGFQTSANNSLACTTSPSSWGTCPSSSGTCSYASGNGTGTCRGNYLNDPQCNLSRSQTCSWNSCPASSGSCTTSGSQAAGTCTGTQACSTANTQTCTWNTCPASWESGACTYTSGNGTGTCQGAKTCTQANPQTGTAFTCPSGGTYVGAWNAITNACTYTATFTCPSGGTLSGGVCVF